MVKGEQNVNKNFIQANKSMGLYTDLMNIEAQAEMTGL